MRMQMSDSNGIPAAAVEAAAWASYVHSLDGRTDLKVTDEPKWKSDFHREKYMRRAREIFAAAVPHMTPDAEVEFDENGERLITSSDINRAGAAKANALWGGKQ